VTLPAPLRPDEFAALLDVSRETLDRLAAYIDLLAHWQRRINLVGAATLPDVWRRHVLDSAQLLRHAPGRDGAWIDVGSGAGFPGLVLAALGVADMHLVESDGRKLAFLAEAARLLGVRVTLHRRRVEDMDAPVAAILTARAFAPLPRLLEQVSGIVSPRTVYLLPKGQDVGAELTETRKSWMLTCDTLPSLSDPRGAVLRLTEVARVPAVP